MIGLLEQLLVRNALTLASRQRLIEWMIACSTGKARLRAGLPSSWRIGDKTGSGARGAVNDIAIAWSPARRAPTLIASFIDAPDVSLDIANAAHAAAARHVAATFR